MISNLLMQRVSKINKVHIARRVTQVGKNRSGFSAMLGAVIDDMHEHMPQRSLEWLAARVGVIHNALEITFVQRSQERPHLLLFIQPASTQNRQRGIIVFI